MPVVTIFTLVYRKAGGTVVVFSDTGSGFGFFGCIVANLLSVTNPTFLGFIELIMLIIFAHRFKCSTFFREAAVVDADKCAIMEIIC